MLRLQLRQRVDRAAGLLSGLWDSIERDQRASQLDPRSSGFIRRATLEKQIDGVFEVPPRCVAALPLTAVVCHPLTTGGGTLINAGGSSTVQNNVLGLDRTGARLNARGLPLLVQTSNNQVLQNVVAGNGGAFAEYLVGRKGSERIGAALLAAPATLTLHDVARDGRALYGVGYRAATGRRKVAERLEAAHA